MIEILLLSIASACPALHVVDPGLSVQRRAAETLVRVGRGILPPSELEAQGRSATPEVQHQLKTF